MRVAFVPAGKAKIDLGRGERSLLHESNGQVRSTSRQYCVTNNEGILKGKRVRRTFYDSISTRFKTLMASAP
jgi:hypothetical protein